MRSRRFAVLMVLGTSLASGCQATGPAKLAKVPGRHEQEAYMNEMPVVLVPTYNASDHTITFVLNVPHDMFKPGHDFTVTKIKAWEWQNEFGSDWNFNFHSDALPADKAPATIV